jgi:uncharacterized protein
MPCAFDAMVRRPLTAALAMHTPHPARWLGPWLILLFTFLHLAPAGAGTYTPQGVPNPRTGGNGYVADPDGILGAEVIATLNAQLLQLERDTGAQVAVVAIGDTDPQDIFSFAQALFERWGIGDTLRDDGLLMLLVKDQRTIRLHTGYGLEGTLPDVVCKRIQEQFMVPEFRRGDYGAGLIAGLAQVSQLLRDPGHAAQFATANPNTGEDAARRFRHVALGALGVIGLFSFIFKSVTGYFSDSRKLAATPPAMRYSPGQWALRMLGAPALIVLVVGQLPVDAPILLTLAAIYGYFLLMSFVQLRRQQRYQSRIFPHGNYTAITRFLRHQRGFWRWIAILFPLPFAIYPMLLGRRIQFYRTHPRRCPECRRPMRLLSEADEDEHLATGQQVEEAIDAFEHDVWHCEACGCTRVVSFDGEDEDDYERCPECSYRTFFLERDETTLEPSDARKGEGIKVKLCKHCGHRSTMAYTIPRLNRSGSSSSGGRSSGGGFGGGSSGGGGSSSSW